MTAPTSAPTSYEQALAIAEAMVAARGAGPDPVATAAAVSDQIITTRDTTAEWAKTAIRHLWTTVNPYDPKQVQTFTVEAARLMESAQMAVSRMAAAGQAQQLAAMGIPTDAVPSNPVDVRGAAAVVRKGMLVLQRMTVGVGYAGADGDAAVSKTDMTTQGVFLRPAMVYRYAKSQGAPDTDAAKLAGGRIDDLVENNLMLAQRIAEQEVLVQAVDLDSGKTRAGVIVIGYRRIIHPELSRSGTCGMCIAASDRIYTVGKLLPIHAHCKCTTAAVTEDYDPADDLNTVDLNRLYKDAGGTSSAHLKRTRYKEDVHGELGPVLVPQSKYKPRTTKSKVRVGGTALQSDQPAQAEVAKHQLIVMEENLARLRAGGEPEDSPKVAYHEKLIAKLRKQAGGGEESGTAGSSSGDAGTSADRVTRGGADGPPPPNRGYVAAGASDDDDRAKYRATPPDQRELDLRYAQPLGEVVDAAANGDRGPLKQLAEDLSGVVTARDATFRVTFESNALGDAKIDGRIQPGGGLIGRTFFRDADNKLVVSNDGQFLDKAWQGKGFASAITTRLEDYYRRSGVDRIEVHAADEVGGYAWAAQGFSWDPARVDDSIGNIVQRANAVAATMGSEEARRALAEVVARLVDENGVIRPLAVLPTPKEIAALATSDQPELGKAVMLGSDWYGWKKL